MEATANREPRLIGRHDELGRLESLLEFNETGARAVAIAGEAGIGKTRLLDEAARYADSQGALVLEGRAAEQERDLPFAIIVDALDDYVATLNPRLLESLGADVLAELGRVLPALAEHSDSPIAEQLSAEERYRAHRAIGSLLALLATRRPVLLALDDVHWADGGSVELIRHLIDRPPAAPIVTVLAFRPAPAPDPLVRTLGERRAGAELIELGPLAGDDAAALIGGEGDAARREAIIELSGGNPLYLRELARSEVEIPTAARAGTVRLESGRSGGVPSLIDDAIAAELDRLTPDAAALARAASVVGERFEVDEAVAVGEIDEQRSLELLDELLAGDLVQPADHPRSFRFRHPIVHHAVYERTPPGWRLLAHQRAAGWLASRGAAATVRAWHVEMAARPGEDEAIATLCEAGAQAASRAPQAAVHHYRAALRILPGDDPRRTAVLGALAQALAAAGRYAEAGECLDEVLERTPADQHALRAQLVAASSRLDHLLGNRSRAGRRLSSELERLPAQATREAVDLRLALASDAFFHGDFAALHDWAEQALRIDPGDEPATAIATLGLLGCADYMTDRVDGARRRLDELAETVPRLDDGEIGRHLHLLTWACLCEIYLERFDHALALVGRLDEVAHATGRAGIPTLMRIVAAHAHCWRGELDEAAELLSAAIDSAELTRNQQFHTWALWSLCWRETLAGDLPSALAAGEMATDVAGELEDPVSAMAPCYLAAAQLEAGKDPERWREVLLGAAGGPELRKVERGFRAHWYEILTMAELAAGDAEAAARWATAAERSASGLAIRGRDSEAARALAAVALAEGDADRAAELALTAVEHAEAAGLPIEAGRGRVLTGRALAAAGRTDEATRELEAAHRELGRRGAERYRDAAARELRGLGRSVPRPGRRGRGTGPLSSLSGRERDVAELVAEGRTNREIGATLFLSEKTIESHMTRIFGKLELTSRAQLAGLVAREGNEDQAVG